MEQIERIIRLHNLLSTTRHPIARKAIQERLECSEKTVRRDLDFLRDRLGAPIHYNEKTYGWHYDTKQASLYELPGLWLNEKEIHALLTIQQLINSLDPELLQNEITPFAQRIRKLLEQTTGLQADEEISQYIQLLSTGKRKKQYQHFQGIASATLCKKRIHIRYFSRGKAQTSERILSPNQLLHYKENWYLSAWCHTQQAMRIFSLDKIEVFQVLTQKIKSIPTKQLTQFTSASFGIFTGQASQQAVLIFNAEASRWVADEVWHPKQQGEWLHNGQYQLTLPYSNPIELAGEILRHGEHVVVQSPDSLIEIIKQRLNQALSAY